MQGSLNFAHTSQLLGMPPECYGQDSNAPTKENNTQNRPGIHFSVPQAQTLAQECCAQRRGVVARRAHAPTYSSDAGAPSTSGSAGASSLSEQEVFRVSLLRLFESSTEVAPAEPEPEGGRIPDPAADGEDMALVFAGGVATSSTNESAWKPICASWGAAAGRIDHRELRLLPKHDRILRRPIVGSPNEHLLGSPNEHLCFPPRLPPPPSHPSHPSHSSLQLPLPSLPIHPLPPSWYPSPLFLSGGCQIPLRLARMDKLPT